LGLHHHHHQSEDRNIKVAFFLNLAFTIVEIVGGLMTNSVAILTDALHDFGDSVSLGVAWYFQKVSKKGRTERFSYGYRRFSLLGAFINAFILFGGSIFFLTQAIPRLFNPENPHAKGMIFIAILGVIVNSAAMFQLKKGKSINAKVIAVHLMEDVLGWIAVLVGAIVMHFYNLPIIDPILSIAISVYVLVNVVKNMKDAFRVILQSTPKDVNLKDIEAYLKSVKNIQHVHNLHVWSMDGDYNILSVNLVVDEQFLMKDIDLIKDEIKVGLERLNIHHPTLEFETKLKLNEAEESHSI
jgi:cobalt-zinc-cadmium efflux system protein